MLRVLTPLVYLLLCVLSVPAVAERKPNILVLLADDFGYNDSGIYRDIFQQTPVASMPALESLAAQGMRFTRFYTESTCSSSRAALLTGQYAARNGFTPVARGISPGVVILPEYLKSRGYVTHLVGKWHVGELNQEAFPERQGFDSTFGFLGQWFLKGPDKTGVQELKSPTYHNPWLRSSDVQGRLSYRQYHGHLEDILTKRTVSLIRDGNKTNAPWFIYHAFFAPHTPLEPAERFAQQFENSTEGKYRALLAQMDDNILQIFTALKEAGEWDNTIIIFASDNGSPDKVSNSNAPFSGEKAQYEEGGIRTPLVIKWNQPLSHSATRDDVVSIMDIYPSLVSAIGDPSADLHKLDGIPNLLPDNPPLRDTPLYFLTYGSLSVLSADGTHRLLRDWDAGNFTRSQLFKYEQSGLPVSLSDNWLESLFGKHRKTEKKLFNDFLQWRDQLRVVPTRVEESLITGSNFLRTPINPSFAVAFSFSANDITQKQSLLLQKNILDVYLEKGVLHAAVHGIPLKAEAIHSGVCYNVVLSGEFYDRFSGVHGDIRTSSLNLMLNGKRIDSANRQINSFESVDISSPTVIGKISGVISKPVFFSTQLLPDDKPLPSGFSEATARFNACRVE